MKNRRKIFQRAAALLCCMLFLPSLVAVPAHAASDTQFYDVLQFGTANGSGTNVVTDTLPFTVVYETTKDPYYYVDLVVVSAHIVILNYNGQQLTRRLINYANGVYRWRFFGDLVGDPSGYLTFDVSDPDFVGQSCTVVFEQLRVSKQKTIDVPTVGTVFASPYEWVVSEAMPDPDTPASITFKFNDVSFPYEFFSEIRLTDWVKYDYLDVYFNIRCSSINSIVVKFDGQYLPHELNYLNSGLVPDQSWGSDGASPPDNTYNCVMRIDLTGVNRSLTVFPTIYIDGTYMPYVGAQGIQLTSVSGIVFGDVPSDLSVFWMRLQGFWFALHADLKTFFEGLFSGSDEFQAEVDKSVTDFEDAESEIDQGLDSLDTPDIDDVDIVGKIQSSGAKTATLGDFFDAAFNNVVVNWLMILSFSFMLISFLLYGSFR